MQIVQILLFSDLEPPLLLSPPPHTHTKSVWLLLSFRQRRWFCRGIDYFVRTALGYLIWKAITMTVIRINSVTGKSVKELLPCRKRNLTGWHILNCSRMQFKVPWILLLQGHGYQMQLHKKSTPYHMFGVKTILTPEAFCSRFPSHILVIPI